MRRIVTLIGCLALSCVAGAQDPRTGIPPFSSIQSLGIDNINQANLNVNFSIPISSTPGRGIPFSFPITNDSLLWRNVSGGWNPVLDVAGSPTWGWKTVLPSGSTKFAHQIVTCDTPPPIQHADHYQGYAYVDPAGTVHNFNLNFYHFTSPLCTDLNTGPTSGYATDGSGFFIDASSPSSPKITSTSGSVITGTAWTDSNGNFLSATVVSGTETDWKDSAGLTPLKILTSATSTQYQFPDSTGVYHTATLKLTSTSIKTHFSCSGVIEYTGTANLPTELDIPTPAGGTLKYFFTYEPTPGNPGFYTGRIQKVTLPTGGSYQYDYPGANDSAVCTDGTTLQVNRTVSDGTNSAVWKFVRNTASQTTTVTIPQLADTTSANDIVYTFSGGHEVSRKVYANSPGTTLLRSLATTWATNGTPASQILTLEDGSTKAETDTSYDSNGLLGAVTEYDWGTGAHGSTAPIRTTSYTFQTSSNYTSRNLINLVTSKVITDGAGSVQYRQDTTYDANTITNCPTGITQHDDTHYGCTMNFRGNPTSVTTYLTPATPANGVTKNFTYDVFGNILTAQLNCCQTKTWTYSATTNYSQADSVTRGTSPTQLATSSTYSAYNGLLLTDKDENNQVTQYSYDLLNRLTTLTRPDSNLVTNAYDDVNFLTSTTIPIDSSRSGKQVTSIDPLGRQVTATAQDSTGTVYSRTSTGYDLSGRVYQKSNPYMTTPLYWTTLAFDALGRTVSESFPDGSQNLYSYSANAVTSTDPAGNHRKTITDAAERIASVYEPDVSNGNSLTLQTSYGYSVLDSLQTVSQGVQNRTYHYDALGRLLNSTIPETNNVQNFAYTYDNFDNLATRTDARGVVATLSYDGLNRLNGIAYTIPIGSSVSPMPNNICDPTGGSNKTQNVCVFYDQGGATAFALGRTTKVIDPSGSATYSYNLMGEVTQISKTVGSTAYNTSYSYNFAAEPTQTTYPSGRVVLYNYDNVGRLCSVGTSGSNCTVGTLYSSGYAYNAAQQITGFTYGNGVAASFGYSSDRLQLASLSYVKSGSSLFGVTYSYGFVGSNNGLVSNVTDSVQGGRSAGYTYDGLARLSTASTTGSASYPAWGLSWTYDRYANRLAQSVTAGTGVPSNSVSVGATTNQITGSPYLYDASGNMTNDGLNTIAYDGENRVTNSSNGSTSASYTYDNSGQRVKKVSSTTSTVYIYSGANVVAEYDNGSAPAAPTREYIYSGTSLLARIDSGGTKYYHQDNLSNRLVTDSSGAVSEQMGHYPYGETWYNASNDKLIFTSYVRDSESGNDNAADRIYSSRLGRFSSIDQSPGSVSNPQSLDGYAYVLNDPINFSDPTGDDPFCIGPPIPIGPDNYPIPPGLYFLNNQPLPPQDDPPWDPTIIDPLGLLAGMYLGQAQHLPAGSQPSPPSTGGPPTKADCRRAKAAAAVGGTSDPGSEPARGQSKGSHQEFNMTVSGAQLKADDYAPFAPFGVSNGYRNGKTFFQVHVNGRPNAPALGPIANPNANVDVQGHFDVINPAANPLAFVGHGIVDLIFGSILSWLIPGNHLLDPPCK